MSPMREEILSIWREHAGPREFFVWFCCFSLIWWFILIYWFNVDWNIGHIGRVVTSLDSCNLVFFLAKNWLENWPLDKAVRSPFGSLLRFYFSFFIFHFSQIHFLFYFHSLVFSLSPQLSLWERWRDESGRRRICGLGATFWSSFYDNWTRSGRSGRFQTGSHDDFPVLWDSLLAHSDSPFRDSH
jgi:hypothetical protein